MISRGRRRHIVKVINDAEAKRIWNAMTEEEKDETVRKFVGHMQEAIANVLRMPLRMFRF